MVPLDIKHLRYFAAVAEELHFGRAAVKLALTQPALSQQIAALESLLGVQLLIRDRRSVVLTDAGQAFLKPAKDILSRMETLVEVTRRAAHQNEQRIAIGIVEYTDLPFLVPALTELQKLYPNVKIIRNEMNAPQQVKTLNAGQIDIGVGVLLSGEDHALRISSRPLIDGRWVLAVSRKHRLSKYKEIALTDLTHEKLIIFSRSVNPPLYDGVVESFHGVNIKPNFIYETTQAHIGLRMVRDGSGVMLGADYVLREKYDNVAYVPVSGLPPLNVHIFWRENEGSGLVLDFSELLAEAAGKI